MFDRITGTGRRSRGLVVGLVAIVGLVSLVAVGPASPALADTGESAGFVWAHDLSSAIGVPYTPSPNYQYNSASPSVAVNTVTHITVGEYAVFLPYLAGNGVTHVTAYGQDSGFCDLEQEFPASDGMTLYVGCYGPAGYHADHMFTLSYAQLTYSWQGRQIAYMHVDGANGAIYPGTDFNSSGASNSVYRGSTGHYVVTLPTLGGPAGHVQVTAQAFTAVRCKVARWNPFGTGPGSDQTVFVLCFTRTGALVDSNFTLTYVNQVNILGQTVAPNPGGHESAYAFANQPGSASYLPTPAYQFDDFSNTAANVTRSGVGRYSVTFGYTALVNGNVQVTAVGGGTEYCNVAYWYPEAGIQVRCFSASGVPVDAPYDIAFTGPMTG